MSSGRTRRRNLKFAIIGYGSGFNMGDLHIESIVLNEGFELAAICDVSRERLAIAREKYPKVKTYRSVDSLLKRQKVDLAVIITPHNIHAAIAMKCLVAGVHVVTEKPMAISTEEVKAMIDAAQSRKLILSTFHNRRWDVDFLKLFGLIESGVIGRVFRLETGFTLFDKQRDWWRSDREISGGNIFDWGAHFTDWVLLLIAQPVRTVSGFMVKNPSWSDYMNEDHSEFTLTFADGCLATLVFSNMSMISRPQWTVRGEKGAIVSCDDRFNVSAVIDGRRWTTTVSWKGVESDWHAYYRNICAHIRDGEPLIVTAESAARVIAIIDSSYRSARQGGKPVKPAYASEAALDVGRGSSLSEFSSPTRPPQSPIFAATSVR